MDCGLTWAVHDTTIFSCQSIFKGALKEMMMLKNALISVSRHNFHWSQKSGVLVLRGGWGGGGGSFLNSGQ